MQFVADRWRSMVRGWRSSVERPISTDGIADVMRGASMPAFGFYFMLALATAIATFGLVANSAPAIIGAMIIAPLMSPIISLSYGIVAIDWRMVVRSALTVASGAVLVVTMAFVSAEVIGLRIAGSEILGRTSPTLLDLGVAMAAGAAGAFVHTRKGILNSIAGVAIAVALVPPLAVTGIGLSLGRQASAEVGLSLSKIGLYSGGDDIAFGAFLLFLTNLIGIVVCSALVLICHGYGHWKRALVGLVLLVGVSFAIVEPLNDALYRLYVKSTVLRLISTLRVHQQDLFVGTSKLESIIVRYENELIVVDIDLFLPRKQFPNLQKAIDIVQTHLSSHLDENVLVKVSVVLVDMHQLRSSTMRKSKGSVDAEVIEEID